MKQSPPPLYALPLIFGQPVTPANITTGTPATSCSTAEGHTRHSVCSRSWESHTWTICGRSRREQVIVVPSVKTTVVL